MRVLIDECVDPRVKQLLPEHAVATVHERGWGSLKDGPLLRAADGHFDVFLTIDRKLEFQQNLSRFRIAIVVVHVPKNQLPHYRAILERIRAALSECHAGAVTHVASGVS